MPSRYEHQEIVYHNDGKQVVQYLKRRFLPSPDDLRVLLEERVNPGDRLDLMADRTMGDPTFFWRIADINAATDPFEMMETGKTLKIPVTYDFKMPS